MIIEEIDVYINDEIFWTDSQVALGYKKNGLVKRIDFVKWIYKKTY